MWYNGPMLGDGHQSIRHARRRALIALAMFAGGAYIGVHLLRAGHSDQGTGALGLAGLFAAVCIVARGRARGAVMAACVLLLGVGWSVLRLEQGKPDDVATLLRQLNPEADASRQAVPIEVRGVVTRGSRVVHRERGLADPPMWPATSNQSELEVTALLVHRPGSRTEWVRADGDLRLLLPGEAELEAGERFELLGRFSPPGTRRNPGDADWDLLAAQRGFSGSLIVEHAGHIVPAERGGVRRRVRSAWLRARDVLRERALRSIGIDDAQASDEQAAARAALLLGERDPRFEDVYSRFQRVGVAHVLAISGFHLALVVFMCTLGVRVLGEHPRVETAIVVAILLGVVVFIPLRPPIVRAAVIVGAMLLANRFGRRYDRLTVLAWVGLGLLIWRPLDTTSLGYQLSMGVTALLVVLSDTRLRAIMERQMGLGNRVNTTGVVGVWRWLLELVWVNVACWLVALPIIAYHAGVVGTLAPVASIMLVPLVGLLMAAGYIQIIIGIVSPDLAMHTGWLIEAPSGWVLGTIAVFDSIPYAWVRVPGVSALWSMCAALVLGVVVTRVSRLRDWRVIAALLLIGVWGGVQPVLTRPDARVRVVMFDVGDGSCVLVQSGGTGILWDCGSLDRRVGQSIGRALRELGVRDLAGVVVTHDNLDHYNGLPDLAQSYPIRRLWITDRLDRRPSAAWSRVRGALEMQGAGVELVARGDSIRLGDVVLRTLWPPRDVPDGFDDNDTSMVTLIETESGAVLLTGDIEGDAMGRLRVLEPGLAGVTAGGVIELPHHGSARDEAYGFLDWLDPGVVLQSTGPSRLGDERWDAQRQGRRWLATAERGAIIVELRDEGIVSRYWFD
ncbi:MAG: ComEC/Rec2 family competence protein [Phycisphaerales bacterium]